MLGYGTPSVVQMTLIAFLLAYAWTVRKMNRAAISVVAAAIALLHMYDHLYRIKRGEERLFLLPEEQTENYFTGMKKGTAKAMGSGQISMAMKGSR